MKKKILLATIVVVVLICGIIAIKSFMGAKPFKNLSVNDISSATVELYRPQCKNGTE